MKTRQSTSTLTIPSETDILLIEPPYSMEERYGKVGKTGGFVPPMGLAALAAYMIKHKYTVDVIDSPTLGYTAKDIMDLVEKYDPKCIGISSLTPSFKNAVGMAKLLKERFPNKLIIIGGHHATILPKEVIQQNDCFDVLVYGEGELTLHEVMNVLSSVKYNPKKFLSNYARLRKINGIVYRQGKSTIMTNRRELITDVDELPLPARHLLPMDRYIPLPNQYKRRPSVVMLVIRGCPYQCAFCSANIVFGRMIRPRSPKNAVDEIKHVMKEYGAKEISFWDDMLTSNKVWLREFCNRIIDEKLDILWTCYARADSVDLETLSLMKKAGCWNIFFGFEAGDQTLLNNIDKRITLEQIRNVVKWCKKVGIEIRASFMLALPGETPKLALKTIKFAISLNAEYTQFSITTPFPGTRLFDIADQYGRLDKDFSQYNDLKPVFVPHGYKDEEEIKKMARLAMRMYYYRPRYVLDKLRRIESFEDVRRNLKGIRFLFGLFND
jgi:anaerobic magnesium-protoporphyrin IX monomethyl ester cyclase